MRDHHTSGLRHWAPVPQQQDATLLVRVWRNKVEGTRFAYDPSAPPLAHTSICHRLIISPLCRTYTFHAHIVSPLCRSLHAPRARAQSQGVTGLTGRGGWYVHWNLGAPKTMRVWAETVPRGTSILYASRYPPGTTFNVTRAASAWLVPDAQLLPASSLDQVLASDSGEYYYFDGSLLFFKVVDIWEQPYQGREPARGEGTGAGLSVPGSRWGLYYQVCVRARVCVYVWSGGAIACVWLCACGCGVCVCVCALTRIELPSQCLDVRVGVPERHPPRTHMNNACRPASSPALPTGGCGHAKLLAVALPQPERTGLLRTILRHERKNVHECANALAMRVPPVLRRARGDMRNRVCVVAVSVRTCTTHKTGVKLSCRGLLHL